MKCSKCHSPNIQKLKIIYETGTREFESTSVGYKGAFASSSGVSQSKLARIATPPARRSMTISWGILVFMGFVDYCGMGTHDTHGNSWGLISKFLIFTSPIIAGCVYQIYKASQYNNSAWPNLYKKWSDSWMCRKCGNVYHDPT